MSAAGADSPGVRLDNATPANEDNTVRTGDPSTTFEKVTADGGVLKCITQQGVGGGPPPLHARCLVHYVGRLAASGEVFMDTRSETPNSEPVHLVAGRESSLREVGLTLAVATMQKGERCKLKVQPNYGYGPTGNFSFPSIPPCAELEYDLELLEWEPVSEARGGSSLTYEERLEAAVRKRLEGNARFKAGDTADALGLFAMALSHLGEDLLMQLEGRHLTNAQAVRAPILLNMAACQLRLGDTAAAAANCSQVLAVQPDNAKALFRRGLARHKLGQSEAALEDLAAAARLEPGDSAVAAELRAVRATLRAERAAGDQLFRGKLPPSSVPPSASRGFSGYGAGLAAAVARVVRWVLDVARNLGSLLLGQVQVCA